MPERRVKVPFPLPNSPQRDGSEVPITESTERFTEVHLEDGTVIRIKPSVMAAIRVDNEYDQEGNPTYSLKMGQVVAVVSSPENLRRGGKGSKAQ